MLQIRSQSVKKWSCHRNPARNRTRGKIYLPICQSFAKTMTMLSVRQNFIRRDNHKNKIQPNEKIRLQLCQTTNQQTKDRKKNKEKEFLIISNIWLPRHVPRSMWAVGENQIKDDIKNHHNIASLLSLVHSFTEPTCFDITLLQRGLIKNSQKE